MNVIIVRNIIYCFLGLQPHCIVTIISVGTYPCLIIQNHFKISHILTLSPMRATLTCVHLQELILKD